MTRVLVTGASGFIGFHLVKALVARGNEVTCLVRKTSKIKRIQPLGVALAYGDVTDPHSLSHAVAGQSVVYHVAGLTMALRREELYRVNGQGVRNVARACAEKTTPPVMISVSSLAAAGPAPRDRLRTENDPPAPVSHYGRSKRAGELAAEEFAHRVPITVVRPPIVVGEADPVSLVLFRSVKRSRIHLVAGYTPHHFSLIHAADLAELLILAADRGQRLEPPAQQDHQTDPARGYYFADSGEQPTYYQLGHMIGDAMGYRRVFSISFTMPVVWSVAAIANLVGQIRRKPVYLSIDKVRDAAAGSWACSSRKAAEQLGFSVTVPLADRLRQTVQWYRQEGWL